MQIDTLPVLSLADDPARFAQEIGDSFKGFGFALVRDHGIDQGLIDQAWRLTAEFFALPEAEKRQYYIEGIGGARGYTPFGTEIAKGAKSHDLKEFWHVGRDVPRESPLADSMPPNIWPSRPEGFRTCFEELYRQFDACGATILSRIAVYLGLEEHWFDPTIDLGNSVMRLLHYPPLGADSGG
jgi:isopenicillin N synthase-like dioxygenase